MPEELEVDISFVIISADIVAIYTPCCCTRLLRSDVPLASAEIAERRATNRRQQFRDFFVLEIRKMRARYGHRKRCDKARSEARRRRK